MLGHSRAFEGASSADTIHDNFKAYSIEDEGGKSGGPDYPSPPRRVEGGQANRTDPLLESRK